MDFNYLGLVNRILMMAQQTPISTLETDNSTWGYKAQLSLNDAVKDILVMLNVKSTETTFSFSTVAGQRLYALPRNIVFPPLSMKHADGYIDAWSEVDYDRLNPNDTSRDNPSQYYLEDYAPVILQPSSSGTIAVKSSSGSDNSKVVVSGWTTTNQFQVEEISLLGTSWVNSTYSYTHITNISKLTTLGTITVSDAVTNLITYVTLDKNENSVKIPIIGLYPIPSKVTTVTGRGLLNIPSMTYANETPAGLQENTVNAIVATAFARLMQYDPKMDTMSKESLWQLSAKEIAKLTALNARDGVQYSVKSPSWNMAQRKYFRPLDR